MTQNRIEIQESLARVKERGTVTNGGWLKVRKSIWQVKRNNKNSGVKWLKMIEMDTMTQRKRLTEMEREKKLKKN